MGDNNARERVRERGSRGKRGGDRQKDGGTTDRKGGKNWTNLTKGAGVDGCDWKDRKHKETEVQREKK